MPESPPSPAAAPLLAAGEWTVTLGLAATLAWTTLCLGGYRPETMAVTSTATFGLAGVGLLLAAFRPGARLNLATLLPLPFLLFALASARWLAPARWLADREWLLWLQAWLVFVLVLHHARSRAQTWVLAATMAGLGAAGAGMAAWQRFHDPGWLMLGRHQVPQFFDRSAGMFGVPNSLAGLVELLIPVCLALLVSRAASPAARLTAGWLAAVLLFALVLTGSRGGWIGLALALGLWPVFFGRNWKAKAAGVLAVGVVAAAAVVALYQFSDAARGRIRPFLTGEFEATRPLIWRAGLEIWQERPWWGTGAASYNVLFDQHRPAGFVNEPQWTHNDYLNTLSDYGLVGFALWAVAGGAILRLGWQAVRRRRRERAGGGILEHWRWRQGLWLGLVAFAFHLFVDFHTKIPALAFAAALAAGLMLRDEPALLRRVPAAVRWAGLAFGVLLLVFGATLAAPLYRGEALRYGARQQLDDAAAGSAEILDQVLPRGLADLQESVKIAPDNGQAWADLSWAIALSWHVTHGSLAATGARAAGAADRAIALCPVMAESWVRKGEALDMEARHGEAESCFRRALELAPNRADWHYAYAYHLNAISEGKSGVLAELATCLALDPGNSAAVSLRDRLKASR